MNIKDFTYLYELKNIGADHLVDPSDSFNYHYTPIMFFLFFLIIGCKQYVFKPIQCWVPPEFSRSWEEYAENYCWVQPTYVVQYDGRFPLENERKEKLNYYQWVPIVLLLQMLLSLVPYFLWKKIANNVGFNLHNMIKLINKEKLEIESDEDLDNLIKEIANKFTKFFKNRLVTNSKTFNFRNKSLFFGYIFIKLFLIVLSGLQIVIMKYFIGNVTFTFGWDILHHLLNKNDWKKTNLFPRISGCDVILRRSGQPITYSFLCVLPINMLNEKIYIFLWFWMVFCSIISLISLIFWLYKMFSMKQKKKLIYKLLLIEQKEPNEISSESINQFISSFLKIDGIFIIEMITQKHGIVISALLLSKIYQFYKFD